MRDWAALLVENGLPPAPGSPVAVRWIARSGDWWAKTEEGWFWLRNKAAGKEWVQAPMGPPD